MRQSPFNKAPGCSPVTSVRKGLGFWCFLVNFTKKCKDNFFTENLPGAVSGANLGQF